MLRRRVADAIDGAVGGSAGGVGLGLTLVGLGDSVVLVGYINRPIYLIILLGAAFGAIVGAGMAMVIGLVVESANRTGVNSRQLLLGAGWRWIIVLACAASVAWLAAETRYYIADSPFFEFEVIDYAAEREEILTKSYWTANGVVRGVFGFWLGLSLGLWVLVAGRSLARSWSVGSRFIWWTLTTAAAGYVLGGVGNALFGLFGTLPLGTDFETYIHSILEAGVPGALALAGMSFWVVLLQYVKRVGARAALIGVAAALSLLAPLATETTSRLANNLGVVDKASGATLFLHFMEGKRFRWAAVGEADDIKAYAALPEPAMMMLAVAVGTALPVAFASRRLRPRRRLCERGQVLA